MPVLLGIVSDPSLGIGVFDGTYSGQRSTLFFWVLAGNLLQQMEEIKIPAHSAFVGETLVSSGFRKEIGVIIVGIKKSHGKMVFNPHSQTRIEEHDTLIVLGDPTSIHKLKDLVARPASDEIIKQHRKDHHEK